MLLKNLFILALLLFPTIALSSEWYSFRYFGSELVESTGICVTNSTPSKLLNNGCTLSSEIIETANNSWKGKKIKLIDCDGIAVIFANDEGFCRYLVNNIDLRRKFVPNSARRSLSGSSASSSCSHVATFEFDGPGAEHHASVQLTVPSSVSIVSGRGTSNVMVGDDGSHCIGGNYSFTYTNDAKWIGDSQDVRSYSGSFSVPSSASYCSIIIDDTFSASVSVSCSQ